MSYRVVGICPCGNKCESVREDRDLDAARLDVANGLREHVEQTHAADAIRNDDGLVLKSTDNLGEAHVLRCQGFPVILTVFAPGA